MSTLQQLLNLGFQHHQSGELQQAEQVYRRVLQADPNQVDALHLLGLIAHQGGRRDVAIDYLGQAVRLKPDFAEAHNNLAGVLLAQGQTDEAAASYRRALALKPDYADAHQNLAVVLRERGALDEAAAHAREAVRLKPASADAHNYLGTILRAQGQLDAAAASYHRALNITPNLAEALHNLGTVLYEQGKLDEASARFRTSVHVKPDFAEAHHDLGVVLRVQGELDEAEASLQRALRLRPGYPEAYYNLGVVARGQGKLDSALARFREALRLKPDYADAHFSLGMTQLLMGDYEPGWGEYEWRWKTKGYLAPPGQLWNGSDLAGRTILLHAEQGFGDTLQFIRYAPLVKQRGGTVLLVCPPALLCILASCAGIDQLVPAGGPLPPADVHAPLMSLPYIFATRLQSVPARIPYLAVDEKLVERRRHDLEAHSGLRIGVVWQGNPQNKGDRDRSIALSHFAALAQLPRVQLFSLQKGAGTEQLRMLTPSSPIIDLECHLDDFMDTAAIIKNLDLVVTVDTAVAHLAGALGVPVWIALPRVPDWRWLLEREESPWYPTARLFRQTGRGDWHGVFRRIAAALGKLPS